MNRILLPALLTLLSMVAAPAAELKAGVARVEITDRSPGLRVNDPLFAKALVLQSEGKVVVLITLDVVAIGEIGRIKNDFLANVRAELERSLGISGANVLINASHCHGVPRADTEALTIQAVKEAWKNLAPVRAGAGLGAEARLSENRRLKLKDGSEVDMRRAYSLPRDEEVAAVGPIDPQIGVLRLDRADGQPLAILYNFACHPIMNPPSKGNSADFPGTASKVIEENLDGAMAFFVQGCAGDVNPRRYKEVSQPADAEPLGNLLGLAVLRTAHEIGTQSEAVLKISREAIILPRGSDLQQRINAIEAEQTKLLRALTPTNINFKTFLPLLLQQKLSPDFPAAYAQSYLHDQKLGDDGLARLDAENCAAVEAYLKNIQTMERLTRLNTNQALLKKHLAATVASGKATLDVEVCGLRIGDFKLVTFPGELTVQVGLNIKQATAEKYAFVAGYTNGYIYYAATAEQRRNTFYAQEDCDSLVAPEWQKIFEAKAVEILKAL